MHTINKGIGKAAEFKGVKGNAIFILLGTFFLNFMILMILQIAGMKLIPLLITFFTIFGSCLGFLYWFVQKFGENGFEKFLASLKQDKKLRCIDAGCFQQLIQKK